MHISPLQARLAKNTRGNTLVCNFHSRTVHRDVIKVFTPTDAKVFFVSIKIYIKTAPTRFGVITILRKRTI